ncbi:MAG: hypothetical protein WA988_01000 [Candidatus Nanopelagicales bacterium]
MGSSLYTSGSVTIPASRIGALAEAFEVLRSEVVGDVLDKFDTSPVVTSQHVAEFLLELAGGSAVETRYGYCNGEASSHQAQSGHHAICVAVGEGRAQPGWASALRLLAEHGAAGEFEHENDEAQKWRDRIVDGEMRGEDGLDDYFVGDTIAWIGQMQEIDDTAMDLVVTTRTQQQAVAALADAARARNIEMEGEVEPDAIPDNVGDLDVLEIWKRIAGVEYSVRPVIVDPIPNLRALPAA